ncbi:MAG: AraC family transcriptional regulator [Bacillota bacterium]|nr:AraC family transcriptional regulator [Bacillota bacterium]
MSYEYEFIRHLEVPYIKFFFVSVMNRLYHWHGDIEILLVVDGSVELNCISHKYKLEKNDIFILNSNEVHSLTKTEKSNTILAIQFDPKFCKSYFPELQRIVFSDRYITQKHNTDCWNVLIKNMMQIIEVYLKKDKYYTLKLMTYLHLIICSLMEKLKYDDATEKELSQQTKNLNRLNHIILYIKDNYMNRISLKAIAEELNIDMYYLSHFIKKHLGISFQEYLNNVRLERAVELLLAGKKSLDICIECGFSDYRYLNKAFFKEFNCTPNEFKNLHMRSDNIFLNYYTGSQNEIIHSGKVLNELLMHIEKNI